MPRPPRYCPGGLIYHVLNRANARATIFEKPEDYIALERILEEALERTALNILAYCIMPNHWHLVLRPHNDGDLQTYVRWLSMTHAQRWHAHHDSAGSGHLYQGRFKAFPVQTNHYLLRLLAYVERNPLRAGLVRHSKHWRWSSLWRRESRIPEKQSILSPWPIERGTDWADWLDADGATEGEDEVRTCVKLTRPLGEEEWVSETTRDLGLESTLRPRGRPPKSSGKRGQVPFSTPSRAISECIPQPSIPRDVLHRHASTLTFALPQSV